MKIEYKLSEFELRVAVMDYLEKIQDAKKYQLESITPIQPSNKDGLAVVVIATYDTTKREPCSSGRD